MKVLGILGSPRIGGNSDCLLDQALAVAVGAGVIYWAYHYEQSTNEMLNQEINRARTHIQDLEALNDIQKGRRGELQEIITTVSKPETRILHLAGLDPAPTSSGAILWDVQQNKCLIFGYIPSPPEGKTYQLWYITPSNKKIPSGLLNRYLTPTGGFARFNFLKTDKSVCNGLI